MHIPRNRPYLGSPKVDQISRDGVRNRRVSSPGSAVILVPFRFPQSVVVSEGMGHGRAHLLSIAERLTGLRCRDGPAFGIFIVATGGSEFE